MPGDASTAAESAREVQARGGPAREGLPVPGTGGIVVLGIGNLLAGDDGFGIHALDQLRGSWLVAGDAEGRGRNGGGRPFATAAATASETEQPRFVDGGLLGLDLLTEIESAQRLLVLDAVDAGLEPGRIVRLSLEEIAGPRTGRLSVHQVALTDCLALARLRGRLPGEAVVLGVQPVDVSSGFALSQPVAAALPCIAEEARRILEVWTAPITSR